MYLQPPRSHLRNVEDLINKMAQVISRRSNSFDRLCLARAEFSVDAIPKHLDEADNGVQWRS
jgi:hypothetical protein